MRTLTLVLALLLAGCGDAHIAASGDEPSTAPGAPTFSASPVPSTVSETEACPKQDFAHLASDQATVTDAFICDQGVRRVPGDGMWNFSTVKRITGGLDELLEVYSTPDAAQPSEGVNCTLEGPPSLTVWLHSAKGVSAARANHTVCGKPTAEAYKAFAALTTTVVSETKQQHVQSELSIESGCPESYKDVLSLEEQYPSKQDDSRSLPSPVSGRASVCTYTVEADEQGDRIGHLTKHHDLDAAHLQALNEALKRVQVDETCSRHEQTGFALVSTGKPDSLFIALGGCAVQENHDFWRAGDDVREAVS